MIRRWSVIILTLGVGLFFLLAAVLKLIDMDEFGRAISRYQLVHGPLLWVAAFWVPWLEIAGVAGLWIRQWRQAGAILLLALLVVFEFILLSALIRGLDIDCGCLGTKSGSSVSFALMRNLILMVALIAVVKLDRDPK